MRVVTWNMAHGSHRQHHEEAWRWLVGDLSPDLFLCQEAVVPDWVRDKHNIHWSRACPESEQTWGAGVVTPHPCAPARLPALDDWFRDLPATTPSADERRSIHGADDWLAIAHVELPVIGELLVSSVHSPSYPIEKSRLANVDVSRMKLKQNSDLWFLDVLFHFMRPMIGTRFLVGGDFNASRLSEVTRGERGSNEFFDRIRDEGFVSLHRLFQDAPHQLDYLCADAPVAQLARSCSVQPHRSFSDHAALVADFENT